MGKLATLFVGLLIIGASYAVTALKSFVGDLPENAPVDYPVLVDMASTGLFYLGAIIAAYAVLAVIWGLIRANWRAHKERKQERKQEAATGDQRPAGRTGYDAQPPQQGQGQRGQPQQNYRRRENR